MRARTWIPFATWSRWTPQERAEIIRYYERLGIPWAIDLTGVDDYLGNEIQKDYDEYREDMSLGGKRYDPI